MNKGLYEKLASYFLYITAVDRPKVLDPEIKDAN